VLASRTLALYEELLRSGVEAARLVVALAALLVATCCCSLAT
jgi:hypothetical protein